MHDEAPPVGGGGAGGEGEEGADPFGRDGDAHSQHAERAADEDDRRVALRRPLRALLRAVAVAGPSSSALPAKAATKASPTLREISSSSEETAPRLWATSPAAFESSLRTPKTLGSAADMRESKTSAAGALTTCLQRLPTTCLLQMRTFRKVDASPGGAPLTWPSKKSANARIDHKKERHNELSRVR